MNPEKNNKSLVTDKSDARLVFAYISFQGFCIYTVTYLVALFGMFLAKSFGVPDHRIDEISGALTSFAFLLVALPFFYLSVKHLPKAAPEKLSVSPLSLLSMFTVGWSLVYFGNMIGSSAGSLLNLVFSNDQSSPVNTAVSEFSLFNTLIFIVIIPAISEELIFRKLIIDRTLNFGQGAAAFFSALFFALYHMNVYQLFYAFLAGYLMARVYIKTGNIIYSISIHAFMNFIGAFIPSLTYLMYPEGLTDDNNRYIVIYNIITAAIAIIGALLLLVYIIKSSKRRQASQEAYPENNRNKIGSGYDLSITVLNYGMIPFAAVSLIAMISYFIK